MREGKEGRRAVVNCETLVLNLITAIVYGRELEWDLRELYMLGSYIMSSAIIPPLAIKGCQPAGTRM